MRLEIISPEDTLFSGNVDVITLPGVSGQFSILPGHAPIISALKKGSLIYQANGQKQELEIDGGFVEMKADTVLVCVD